MCYGIGEFLDSMLGLELSLAKKRNWKYYQVWGMNSHHISPRFFFGCSVFAGAIIRGFEDKIARS
jgi:hypothetical protein